MNEFLNSYGPWLLLIGIMFFMMRRGGCCSHGSHGGHGGHKDHTGHEGHEHGSAQGKDAAKKSCCH